MESVLTVSDLRKVYQMGEVQVHALRGVTPAVLARLVATERTQIGMQKAFGYGNGRLARHYLLLAWAIVGGGFLLGVPVGVWLGRVMSVWFATFFRFPVLVFTVEPVFVVIAAAAMFGSAALGAIAALRTVARMAPTVAMTAPAPPIEGRGSMADG